MKRARRFRKSIVNGGIKTRKHGKKDSKDMDIREELWR